MSVKPDHWIRRMALEHKMIEPFTDRQVREGVISYGVSSYGYDIRVADEFIHGALDVGKVVLVKFLIGPQRGSVQMLNADVVLFRYSDQCVD